MGPPKGDQRGQRVVKGGPERGVLVSVGVPLRHEGLLCAPRLGYGGIIRINDRYGHNGVKSCKVLLKWP